jgi:hypothetical protein
MMESSAASQDAKDEAAKKDAAKGEAAKEQATKAEEKAKCVSERRPNSEAIEDAQPNERVSLEPSNESVSAIRKIVSNTPNLKRKRWNPTGSAADVNAGDLLTEAECDHPQEECPKCDETSAGQTELDSHGKARQAALDTQLLGAHSDNQVLDSPRSQCDQSSYTEKELKEHVAHSHHGNTPTVQTLRKLEVQQASLCQQRDLFMDGFVQRGRRMSLAIDKWEMEASLRARQAQEAARQSQMQTIASAESAFRVEGITERMSQSRKEHALRMKEIAERMTRSREDHALSLVEPVQHQEKAQMTYEEYLQTAHDRGLQEVIEHELEA